MTSKRGETRPSTTFLFGGGGGVFRRIPSLGRWREGGVCSQGRETREQVVQTTLYKLICSYW